MQRYFKALAKEIRPAAASTSAAGSSVGVARSTVGVGRVIVFCSMHAVDCFTAYLSTPHAWPQMENHHLPTYVVNLS